MRSVLIVDDNTAVRMVLTDFLNVLYPHVQVLQADDGANGVKMASGHQPDLILLDADMPTMNGYEAAKTLRGASATRHIPIVAISSGGKNEQTASRLRQLANASLPKPFSAGELQKTMQRLLQTRSSLV